MTNRPVTTTAVLPQRRLLVLRHAKSSWSEPNAPDFDRPLNERGRENAPVLGRRMRSESIKADAIIASTARRVKETLELVLPAWKWSGDVHWERQLYLASSDTILKNVSALADDSWQSILVVGHNPGLSHLVSLLTGEAVELPTAALAIVDGPASDWLTALRTRDWRLTAFWKPKDLGE